MNDHKPCSDYDGHASRSCIFLNDEFNSCFNNACHLNRGKIERKIIKHYKKWYGDVPLEQWQNFLVRLNQDIGVMYPCKYNISGQELREWIDEAE